jgi:glycine/D-amino acid oxidase-like deaminating enzyme
MDSPGVGAPRILVVGAGVAGLSLAHALESRGAACLTLADPADPGGATHAAAGLVNPLAGRRWALPWRGRDAFAAAATQFGTAWREVTLVRLTHPAATAQVPTRLAAAAAAGWQVAPLPPEFVPPTAWPPFDRTLAATTTGALVAVADWCAAQRDARRNAGTHLDIAAAPDQVLPLSGGGVLTPWGRFTTAVLATGAALAADLRTAHLPWQRSAGSRVDLLGPPAPPASPVLCGSSWLCPTLNPVRWELGATTIPLKPGQPPPKPHPDEALADQLWEALAASLRPAAWEVTGSRHGVRLALPDRRPVASRIPGKPAIAILAGFGGRGVLHAPWAAARLAENLLHGTPIPPDLDLQRQALTGKTTTFSKISDSD